MTLRAGHAGPKGHKVNLGGEWVEQVRRATGPIGG